LFIVDILSIEIEMYVVLVVCEAIDTSSRLMECRSRVWHGEMLPGKLSALLCCYRAEAADLSLTLMRCHCVQLQKQPEQTLQIYLCTFEAHLSRDDWAQSKIADWYGACR